MLRCAVYGVQPRGEEEGLADPNWALVFAAIMYIQEKRLAVAFSENVANFAQKHKASMQLVVDISAGLGYAVTWRMPSTDDFGIPQIRKRWYTQAVRNDALRSKSIGGVPDWPEPLGVRIP